MFNAFLSFVVSILWSLGCIRDFTLFSVSRIRVRLRNFIDLFMMVTRFLLPLPFVDQLRFDTSLFSTITGIIIILVGLYFISAGVYKIHIKLLYGGKIDLVTDGVYGLVRHPIYLGDILWPIGLSILFGAVCSLTLTPIWILFYLYTIEREEEALIKVYGDRYLEYRRRVKKLIPCVY